MACPPGQPKTIRTDAVNLPWLVLRLQHEQHDLFEAWVEHVKMALPYLVAVDAVEREEDHHAYLKLTYQGNYTVDSSGLSDGTLQILALTILPYLPHVPKILCVEEPEKSIHPRAIEVVLQSLTSLYDSQVWISTYSPIVLAHTDVQAVIAMHAHPEGHVTAIAGPEHPRLRDWHGEIDLGTLFAAGVLG
jgi:predicted ATPase